MFIKIDFREVALQNCISTLIANETNFHNIQVVSENLVLGDIIVANETETFLIIERKTIPDLLSSIKDGRYAEQSFRLNEHSHHNHNIIYLIEGDITKTKKHSADKPMFYSAMLSLNQYKGFSLFRTFSIDETAFFICNSVIKITKQLKEGKPQFYSNQLTSPPNNSVPLLTPPAEVSNSQEDKQYIKVVKHTKKEHITPNNIGEIMLCQIPGVSHIIATAILEKFNSLPELIDSLRKDENCIKHLTTTNSKGITKKINKTCLENIVVFLLKK
jgi:ERCC4-type nuclease